MAFRVDREGYRLDPDGNRIDTSPEDRAKFQREIQQAWGAGHSGEVPPDQTIMIVEKGDCQWTIAEDAGADPAHTAYSMNGQFNNPDLIHPDDAVFLGRVNQYKTGPGGNNADTFGDSVDTRTSDSTDNKVILDTTRYFGSVPPEKKLDVARTVLGSAETSAARQAIIEGYLLSFDPSERAAKAAELRSQFGGAPEVEGNRSPVLADIDAVKLKLGITA